MAASAIDTTNTRIQRDDKLIGGAVPDKWSIDRLYDPAVMTELLYRTKELTDEDFETLIDDIGYRASRIVLRAKACSGDVRALDLYDKIVQRDRASRQKHDTDPRNVTPAAPFVQPARDE